MAANYKDLTLNGLWKNNPALVQLLGLCPLLAVTASVVNALSLGIASMLVLIGSNFAVSLFSQFYPQCGQAANLRNDHCGAGHIN